MQVWDGKHVISVGYHESEAAAAAAYDEAALRLRGDRAVFNFPNAAARAAAAAAAAAGGGDSAKAEATEAEEPEVPMSTAAEDTEAGDPAGAAAGAGAGQSAPAGGQADQKEEEEARRSRFHGVTWSRRSGRWRAQVWQARGFRVICLRHTVLSLLMGRKPLHPYLRDFK